MADAIYVKPLGETEQCEHCGGRVDPEWVVLASDGETEIAGPFETRGEAKQEAISQRDGVAVVLLRADGSVHSEMRAASEPDERPRAAAAMVSERRQRSEAAAEDKRNGQVVNGGTASDGGE